MFPFARGKQIDLTAGRRERACGSARDSKEKKFSNVPKIIADAAGVRGAVLEHLMPKKVRLVLKAPGGEGVKSKGKECVRNPEIAVSRGASEGLYGEGSDLIKGQG